MGDRRNDPTVQTHVPADTGKVLGSGGRARQAIPAKLGRYQVLSLLGQGGVGAVYEADDPELGRRVAIKVLRDDRSEDTEGLRREAQALARLVHPNVVVVHDVGVAGDEVFIVMQLVEGETIDRWIERHQPGPEAIVAMFRQAGEGLAAAHAAGLVHCDFKPGNVLVDAKGVVRVSDFGLARVTRAFSSRIPEGELGRTMRVTTVAGTPAYMAPEQFGGIVTPASDQFSFCVALWECLSGERPFADSSVVNAATLDAAARGPMRELKPTPRMPAYVVRALERGTASEPEARFPSMAALLEALRPPRRGRAIAAAAAVGALVVGGGAAYALWPAGGAGNGDPERRAEGSGPAIGAAGDAGGVDARPLADVAAAKQLTSYGERGCAYAPHIDPSGTRVVFDRTLGDETDLYEVPLAGGAPRALTSAAGTWEWRAQRGRTATEIVHLIYDPEDNNKSKIGFLDLATGAASTAAEVLAWDAVVVGDTLYYSPDEPSGIRAIRGGKETEFLNAPPGMQFFQIAASPAGDRLVTTNTNSEDTRATPCLVDPKTRALDCLAGHETPTRPAFGADGRALYLAEPAGIVRVDLATRQSTLLIPDVYVEGGLAIAPDGSALVYSECWARGAVVDAATGEKVIADEAAVQPVMSRTGTAAWIRKVAGVNVLVVRDAAGAERELTPVTYGSVRSPTFSPDGRQVAFVAGLPNPGIKVVELDKPGVITPLTHDPADWGIVWLETGELAFNRGEQRSLGDVMIMSDAGGEPRRVRSGAIVYGQRGRELLILTRRDLRWLDPARGAERPGPAVPGALTKYVATSPSGTWIVFQSTATGRTLHRAKVDAQGRAGALEHVVTYGPTLTVGEPAITDDGRVLAAPLTWAGDLVVVPAAPGQRF